MNITTIGIFEFRQYNRTLIGMNPTRNNSIVITGANGFGKTSFIDAIQWLFFGDEVLRNKQMQDLILVETAKLNRPQKSKVLVNLEVNGSKYTLTRNCVSEEGNKLVIDKVLPNKRKQKMAIVTATEIFDESRTILPSAIKEIFFINDHILSEIYQKEDILSRAMKYISHRNSITKTELIGQITKLAQKYMSSLSNIKLKISIDSDYKISTTNESKQNVTDCLAKGEKKIIAISVIMALHKLLSTKFPLFFDDCFYALEDDLQQKVYSLLIENLDNQMFFLVKEHEGSYSVELFKKYNSQIFKMSRTENTTELVEIPI